MNHQDDWQHCIVDMNTANHQSEIIKLCQAVRTYSNWPCVSLRARIERLEQIQTNSICTIGLHLYTVVCRHWIAERSVGFQLLHVLSLRSRLLEAAWALPATNGHQGHSFTLVVAVLRGCSTFNDLIQEVSITTKTSSSTTSALSSHFATIVKSLCNGCIVLPAWTDQIKA